MKNVIFILLSWLAFWNCKETKKPEQESKQIKNKIKQVSITTFGGEMGLSDSYTFTIDSIYHDLYIATDTTQNKRQVVSNKTHKWEKLIEIIDLSKFQKAINETSNQEVDGTDININITVENGKEYSSTNADKNKNWNNIYTELTNQITD